MANRTERVEVAVIGGGPAGLNAAITAAKYGAQVLLIDDRDAPGGQLFKQIHKFFGSEQHRAGVRGVQIGRDLLDEAGQVGVRTLLGTTVWGLFPDLRIGAATRTERLIVEAQKIIVATGAGENAIPFDGWTLPGVMGAGAAQTFINCHRVQPGTRALMVGAGNVGLIVAYQLFQAGIGVAAIVEAKPKVGGYLVHAAKVQRAGVPILTGHTVVEARGAGAVEAATVAEVDQAFQPVPGTEKEVEVDLICLAVGLGPAAELCWLAECQMAFLPELGGHVPVHDANLETSVPGLYVAGDVAGIEEASTAMEEGRLAGLAAAESLGHVSAEDAAQEKQAIWQSLDALRQGPFGQMRLEAKKKLMDSCP